MISLGGHQPYIPIELNEVKPKNPSDGSAAGSSDFSQNNCGLQNEWKQRARVLCSYDAKDSTELNLSANEVKY